MASLFAAAATKNVVDIETLDDIDDDEFEQRETGRPPGYCAQTILRFGGLDVMALFTRWRYVLSLARRWC